MFALVNEAGDLPSPQTDPGFYIVDHVDDAANAQTVAEHGFSVPQQISVIILRQRPRQHQSAAGAIRRSHGTSRPSRRVIGLWEIQLAELRFGTPEQTLTQALFAIPHPAVADSNAKPPRRFKRRRSPDLGNHILKREQNMSRVRKKFVQNRQARSTRRRIRNRSAVDHSVSHFCRNVPLPLRFHPLAWEDS